jgi:short-subunit dehydrogenase
VRVLVTGASSGIGEAFARWHAASGNEVVLTGRSQDALARITGELAAEGHRVSHIVADLSDAAGVESLVRQCGAVDVLVANAGVTAAAAVGTTDRDELDRLAYLMSAGVVRLCEALVPGMVARGEGDVVIVSSIAAFTPMRKAAPYAAAKTHATAYARSLSLEVRHKGVRVVAMCPGYVRTDLHRRAGLEHLLSRVPGWMWLDPDDIVRATQRALDRGKVVVVPGAAYRAVRPFLSSRVAQGVWRRLTRRGRP